MKKSTKQHIKRYCRIITRLQWKRILFVLVIFMVIFFSICGFKNKAKASSSMKTTISSSAEVTSSENQPKNYNYNYIVVYEWVNLRMEPSVNDNNTVIEKLLKNSKVILKENSPHRYDEKEREWVYVITDPSSNYGGWLIAESISKIA